MKGIDNKELIVGNIYRNLLTGRNAIITTVEDNGFVGFYHYTDNYTGMYYETTSYNVFSEIHEL